MRALRRFSRQKVRARGSRDPAQPRDIPLHFPRAGGQPHIGDGQDQDRRGRPPARNVSRLPDPRFGRDKGAAGRRVGALFLPRGGRPPRRFALADKGHSAHTRQAAKPNPQSARAPRHSRDRAPDSRNPRGIARSGRGQVRGNRRIAARFFGARNFSRIGARRRHARQSPGRGRHTRGF